MTQAEGGDTDPVADELYGLDPGEFTAARDRRAAEARKAGDRPLATAIKALRRPTVGMWALNLLARVDPDELERLAALGRALRQAHAELDPVQLRELGQQRRALISSLVRQARSLVGERGRQLSEAAVREIEDTLEAGLADDEAAAELRAGRLTRPLESESLGPFATAGSEPDPPPVAAGADSESAAQAAPGPPELTDLAIGEGDDDEEAARAAELAALAEARTEHDRAEAVAGHAAEEATAASRLSADALRDRDAVAAELAWLEEALDAARRRYDRAVTVAAHADRDRQEAEARSIEARRQVEAAARRLRDLDGRR